MMPQSHLWLRRTTDLSYVTFVSDATDLTTYTFSGASIGAVKDRRWIIVIPAGQSNATCTISSVTIGGVTATSIGSQQTGTPNVVIGMHALAVPTGTTADIGVTFSGSVFRCGCAVFSLSSDFAPTTPWDFQSDNTVSANALGVTLSVPALGCAIAASFSFTTSATSHVWTGVTEDYDTTVEANTVGFSGGSFITRPQNTALSITDTISGTPNTSLSALVAASFR